ncbi:uncharacterized protein LOC120284780 [Drosophila simulans]|uniref:uncharacterized protein LOC120284780 n=1 Tax=Drosophila simulans TaxID=7240 RepID=UPI00192D1CDD|nr:uncharacterized protein LOC120284780 [Drosophila simulans]
MLAWHLWLPAIWRTCGDNVTQVDNGLLLQGWALISCRERKDVRGSGTNARATSAAAIGKSQEAGDKAAFNMYNTTIPIVNVVKPGIMSSSTAVAPQFSFKFECVDAYLIAVVAPRSCTWAMGIQHVEFA